MFIFFLILLCILISIAVTWQVFKLILLSCLFLFIGKKVVDNIDTFVDASVAVCSYESDATWSFIERELHDIAVADRAVISVEAHNGSISVVGWDKEYVQVTALKKAHKQLDLEDLRVRVTTTARTLAEPSERVAINTYKHNLKQGKIDYELKVPHSLFKVALDTGAGCIDVRSVSVKGIVTVNTGSGNVVVSGVQGALNVDTGSGSVRVADITKTAMVSTGSGSIKLRSIGGKVSGKTGSGSVRIYDVADEVYASTGSGSITIENSMRAVTASTGSGNITVRRGAQPSGTVSLSTGSGRSRVYDVTNRLVAQGQDLTLDHI